MPMPVSQAMPAVATAKPSGMTVFGPRRGSSTVVPSCAVTIRAPTIGRNATPVFVGLNPRWSCR